MAAPGTQGRNNNSQEEFASSVQEFRVRFEYNSSAEFLEVVRKDYQVERFSVESIICEEDVNASICREDNASGEPDQSHSIPTGVILIVLTFFVSLLAYRRISHSREHGGGGIYQN